MEQIFELIDYLGALAASACFFVMIFLLSLIINFIWISKDDDRTVFEKFGSNFDIRCGVHRMRHPPKKDAELKNMTKFTDGSYGLEADTTI